MLFLLACAAEPQTAAPPEGGGGETVTLSLKLRISDGGGVEGATVSVGDFTGQTDAEGLLAIPLAAGAPYVLRATHEGHVTGNFHGTAPGADFSRSIYFGTEAELSGLVGSIGVKRTDETALLGVEVWRAERDDYGLAGTTVSLDADYAASFVFGPGDWPVEGSTVVEGGGKPVVFVGVTPGTVSVSITTPAGEQCAVMEGGALLPVTVSSGEITILPCLCE